MALQLSLVRDHSRLPRPGAKVEVDYLLAEDGAVGTPKRFHRICCILECVANHVAGVAQDLAQVIREAQLLADLLVPAPLRVLEGL